MASLANMFDMSEITCSKTNMLEFEKSFIELKNELYINRDEVTKLRIELEQANQENHMLKLHLDKMNTNFKENKITTDIFLKKSKDFELKYYEKRDALIKTELHYKLATSEIDFIKNELQKLTVEKNQITRKFKALEEKQKRDLIYQYDNSEKLHDIKEKFEKAQNEVQKLKEECHQLKTLSLKIETTEESSKKYRHLLDNYQQIIEKCDVLQNDNIKLKAKCGIFQENFENNPLKEECNIGAKVFLNHCMNMNIFYKTILEARNSLLVKANDLLLNEKSAHAKLIEDNKLLEATIESMKMVNVKI